MKDPHQRLHDIADARIELDETDPWPGDEATPAAETADKTTPRPRELAAWLLAVLAVAVSAFLHFASSKDVRPSAAPVRFSFNPPGLVSGLAEDLSLSSDRYESVAVSPDGSRLAFLATGENGTPLIWVRPFTDSDATPLEGTDDAEQLFWSPDGERIAFRARGGLFAVPASGGHVQRIATELPTVNLGGSWGNQGVILLAGVDGVRRVDAGGGELTRLSDGDEFGYWPSFLPDGEHFLYLSEIERGKGTGVDNLAVYVASLTEPSQRRLLLHTSSRAIFADGHLLYVNDSALTAHPFNVETLALEGEAVVLEDHLDYFQSHGGATFSVAAGRLIYVTTRPPSAHRWIDRNGEDRGRMGEPASYARMTSISPDGTRAVAAVRSPRIGTSDLVLFDLERETSSRVTTEDSWESYPVWSPDGRHIAYASDADAHPDIFVLDLAGGGTKLLMAVPDVQLTVAWAPNDEILFTSPEGRTLRSLPATGDEDPAELAPAAPGADGACVSPDGRWLAFSALESGRYEIYVQPFQRPGPKVRLSQNGGRRPRWRRDGEELFFQSGRSILTVPIEPGEEFVGGAPAMLFTLEEPFAFQDVMPDGQRFLVLIEPSLSAWRPIQVMIGWQEFLPDASRRVN